MMVEACVRCLRAINSDFSSPVNLPEAMSAKYRMCSSLASACQVTIVFQGVWALRCSFLLIGTWLPS